MHQIFQATPKSWKLILQKDESVKTKVRTETYLYLNGKLLHNMETKSIYAILVDKRFAKPYLHDYWSRTFQCEIIWKDIYSFMKHIPDNRYKQFKYRLLNKIFTSRAILNSWKMVQNPLCLICNKIEDYNHLFIDCAAVDIFWDKVQNLFNMCGIQRNIRSLKFIILGYKISDPQYFFINIVITIVGFSIYKSYFCSENWTKQYDIFKLFKSEIEIIAAYYKHKNVYYQFIEKMLKAIRELS